MRVTRPTKFIFWTGAACCLLACGCRPPGTTGSPARQTTQPVNRSDSRPNVIVILADDQLPGTMGFEGNPHVRTPCLDRLAAEGAYFSHAYVPIPQCAPSRAALLTGQYPQRNGVLRNKDAQLSQDAVTFPKLFKDGGYACGLIGKWHLGNAIQPQQGFEDLWITLAGAKDYDDANLYIDGRKVPANGYITDVLTDHAITFVDRHADRPFLLWLALKAPHPTGKWAPLGDARTISQILLPASVTDDLSTKPVAQRESLNHTLFTDMPDANSLRAFLSVYHYRLAGIDRNVGRLIDRLGKLQLDRHTLVIYMSDNGSLNGQHQMLYKGPFFYEELVRIPIILWWPGHISPKTRIDALVSSMDLFPTLCNRAGIEPPAGLTGKDLWPTLTDPSVVLHETLFLQFHNRSVPDEPAPVRGLVNRRHKYVKYLTDGEELYNLQTDPHEIRNLIAEPTHQNVADSLRQQLDTWRIQIGETP